MPPKWIAVEGVILVTKRAKAYDKQQQHKRSAAA
jgi:hypothetical protein